MRDTEDLLDDSCESSSTYSTSSTIWGPGALTGKFLKALGEKSLGFIESVVIRRRLATMRQTLEKTPHIFTNPQTPDEWRQANEMYSDLKELCREKYSLSFRHTAANLIRDIVLHPRPLGQISISVPSALPETSHTYAMWKRLLVPLQRPGGLLRVPQETVVTVDRQACELKTVAAQENMRPIGPDNPIKVGVTVEITRSSEPVNGILSRRIPLIGTRILRRRRRRNLGGRRLYSSDVQLRESLEAARNTSIPAERPASPFPVRSKPEFANVAGIAQAIRGRINTFRRSPIRISRSIEQPHSCGLHTNKFVDSAFGLNGTSTPARLGADHRSDPPSVDSIARSQISEVDYESTMDINESIVHNRRMPSDILRDLNYARKTVHDLEVELMNVSHRSNRTDWTVPTAQYFETKFINLNDCNRVVI